MSLPMCSSGFLIRGSLFSTACWGFLDVVLPGATSARDEAHKRVSADHGDTRPGDSMALARPSSLLRVIRAAVVRVHAAEARAEPTSHL